MNPADLIPIVLLLLIGLTLGATLTMTILIQRRRAKTRCRWRAEAAPLEPKEFFHDRPVFTNRPSRWVAIKSKNMATVQSALGLHNPRPCSWQKGLASETTLFIAPPVTGWILVFGSDLPDPGDDVDACFHFVTGLSRQLGEVQFFCASRVLLHHTWVRAQNGKVLRGYAWAGRTVWNQGIRTPEENDLQLSCLNYGDASALNSWNIPEPIIGNVEKVSCLASRWSIDPAAIDERFAGYQQGVAGER